MPDYQYGGKKYINAMTSSQLDSANFVLPYLARAIQIAEGNKRNHGVLSIPTSNPAQASNILNNSIVNNFSRWVQQAQPGKFVDFMQKRWAPIGASNDPDNLNQNWAPNVRKSLQQQLGPQEYERWQQYNMSQVPQGGSNEGTA